MKINNGNARNTQLIVNSTLGGVPAPTYPHKYSIFEFPGATTLTPSQYAELSNTDFQSRLTAFIAYVTSQEPGLIIQQSLCELVNTGTCQIGY